jgi:hypothetical protein
MNDGEILAGIFLRLRKMYAAEGGANPEPVLNMTWNYSTPENPSPEEVAMESNGKALADVIDPATGAVLAKKANSSAPSRTCVTVLPPAAAGSLPVAGRRKVTRWPTAITPTRRALVIRWAGHGWH